MKLRSKSWQAIGAIFVLNVASIYAYGRSANDRQDIDGAAALPAIGSLAVALGGAIAGFFAIQQAGDARMMLSNRLDKVKMNSDLATSRVSTLEKQIPKPCAFIKQASSIAKLSTLDVSDLANQKTSTEKLQQSLNRLIEAAKANQCV